MARFLILAWALFPGVSARGEESGNSGASLESGSFAKQVLTDRYYCDGITAGDMNRDGHPDVVAGPFWYAGPDFTESHEFYLPVPLPPEVSPSNSMFSFVHDFSGDGWLDILVLGRVHKHSAKWYENPGEKEMPWKPHFAFEFVRGESPTLVDVDGDSRPELLSHWDGAWGWLRPDWSDPRQPWRFDAIETPRDWPQFYHGQGIGDVNRDGRLDLVINDGWYGQPDAGRPKWNYHAGKFATGKGGAQILIDDVDDDGDADVISALDAHGWGLAWFEQLSDREVTAAEVRNIGSTRFAIHPIMGNRDQEQQYGVAFTQPHALALADFDGDGRQDFVTGKRRWAHGPEGDIEPSADPVVYWFQSTMTSDGHIRFVPRLIDDHSGVGVQIWVEDLNGDTRPDVLTASKLGSFVFLNKIEDADR